MKEVNVSSIKIGVSFPSPVYFEDGKSLFIGANMKITEHDLAVLRQWNVKRLVSSDDPATNGDIDVEEIGELDDVEELEDVEPPGAVTPVTFPEKSFSVDLYHKWISTLETFFISVTNTESIVVRPLDALAQSITSCITSANETMVRTILDADPFGSRLAQNSVNTAVFSGVIAVDAGCTQAKLEPLVTAALLHDVGMLFLPARIVGCKGKLSPQDLKLMQMHTQKGRDFIENKLMYSSFIGTIVYQHHECWIGGGYPCGIAGKKIQFESGIIAVADAFAAMMQDSAYRDSLIGYDAVKELLGTNTNRFNPEILKYFIVRIGLYPVGSFVILSDSSIARVAAHHSESALRPVVKIWVDKDGVTYADEDRPSLDLKQHRELFIVRVLNPKDYKSA